MPLFSGLVEEVGTVVATSDSAGGRRLSIRAPVVAADCKLGDSIAVDGCCLTAVDFSPGCFSVEATAQTLRLTGLSRLNRGDAVNLERALKLSDRLGGHLVTGHVDGIGCVVSVREEGFSRLMSISVPDELSPFFVERGSVAVNGVSLTVAGLARGGTGSEGLVFTVALIPHTMAVTTIGSLAAGAMVNIETDLVAKYLWRWAAPSIDEKINNRGLSLSFLKEHGYT